MNEIRRKKKSKKKDNISLYSKKTTFTAFTETLQQHQNFLRERGGGTWGRGVEWQLLDSLTDGREEAELKLGQGSFKTTLMTVKERKKFIR